MRFIKYINVTDFANRLGISRSCVTDRCNRLKIDYLADGIDSDDLNKYLISEKTYREKQINKAKDVIDNINNY